MSDNTTLNAGSSGDVVRNIDKGGVKTQVVTLDVGGSGAESLVSGTVPVSGTVGVSGTVTVGSHNVTNAGTFAVQAAQSGTWTVQPGNTANTTAWKVDASSVAVPVTDNSGSLTVDNAGTFAVQAAQSGAWNITNVSGTVSLPTGAATEAKQPALGTAGSASADVITVQGVASMTALKVDGSGVTQPVSGTVTITPSGTQTVSGTVAVSTINSVAPAFGSGVRGSTVQRVTIATDDSVPVTGTFWQATQPVSIASTVSVQDKPATSGGLSYSSLVGAASNNKTQVKSSAGQVYLISAQNNGASWRYLKFFDKTSANVSAGTTACDYQYAVPPGGGIAINVDKGIAHANGITIMLTGGIATTDNTSTAASDTVITVGYI